MPPHWQKVSSSLILLHKMTCWANFWVSLQGIGHSPIKSEMKLGPQTHLGAEAQSARTVQLAPKSWKMVIIIPRHGGGTWEGVIVAIWRSVWNCRMLGGLVHHTIMIPAALSLPLLQGACSRSCTCSISKWLVCTRISNLFQSPVFSIARNTRKKELRHPLRPVISHVWVFQKKKRKRKNTEEISGHYLVAEDL